MVDEASPSLPDGIEESDLHAFLDGELEPAREAMVRAWLLENPDAHERLSRYAEQQLALAAAAHEPSWPALPAPLVQDLERGLRRGLWRQRLSRVAATVLLVALGWGANDVLRRPVFASLPDYAQQALDAHEIFANDPTRPVEIPGSSPDEIRRWLSTKLGERVAVPDLKRLGLTLVGARVLGTDEGAAGQLLYEDAIGRRMTLSLAPDEALAPDSPVLEEFQGLEVGMWRSEDFALAAISSDMPVELDSLMNAVDRDLQTGTVSK
ncbi:anti-sigma factor family protein [Niveispirillum sp. KHB5.9]|uniref:anti-sigma factor family protein n=1 Tax=Niveispirillum sp. KHB5.9 TaxID=3400269 RepID=UPI003A8AD106